MKAKGLPTRIKASKLLMNLAGAQIPLEDVPSVQKEIVVRCRQMGKPVIVASHLLQSMMEYPTPTRAEVCPAGLCCQACGTDMVEIGRSCLCICLLMHACIAEREGGEREGEGRGPGSGESADTPKLRLMSKIGSTFAGM